MFLLDVTPPVVIDLSGDYDFHLLGDFLLFFVVVAEEQFGRWGLRWRIQINIRSLDPTRVCFSGCSEVPSSSSRKC